MRFVSLFLLVAFFSCTHKINTRINQTKSAFGSRCKGVTSISWQEQIQGADAATTAKLIAEITAAAEVDAKKSVDLKGTFKGNIDVKSELAKVINQNVKQSSKVSETFWEQETRLGESVCLYLSLLDRRDLHDTIKNNIINDIRTLVNAYNEYTLNKNFVQPKNVNNGINNGVIGDVSINPKPELNNSEKQLLLQNLDYTFNSIGIDKKAGCLDIIVPANCTNPDAGYLAQDVELFVKSQGYNVQNIVGQYIGEPIYNYNLNITVDSNASCVFLIVWM